MATVQALVEAVLEEPVRAEAMLAADPAFLKARTDQGETALHYLVVENQLPAVFWLARQGAEVNPRGWRGETPLMDAARLGHVDMLELLLGLGADPQVRDEEGLTALHYAVWGPARAVELLLSAAPGAVHEMAELYGTPLHLAVQLGRVEVIRALLKGGADPNRADAEGETPLMRLMVDSPETVRLLSSAGASLEPLNSQERSLLHLAAAAGLAEVIRYYLGQGLDPDRPDQLGWTARELARLPGPSGPRQLDSEGWPVRWAAPQPHELAQLFSEAMPECPDPMESGQRWSRMLAVPEIQK